MIKALFQGFTWNLIFNQNNSIVPIDIFMLLFRVRQHLNRQPDIYIESMEVGQ